MAPPRTPAGRGRTIPAGGSTTAGSRKAPGTRGGIELATITITFSTDNPLESAIAFDLLRRFNDLTLAGPSAPDRTTQPPAAVQAPQGAPKDQPPAPAGEAGPGPSSSPPSPTETKPAPPDNSSTSAKPKGPAAPASSPPDPRALEIRDKRVRGAYARRKHKEGGERCVREYLTGKGKEQIEDLDDVSLKVLLDALDKLAELGDRSKGGGAWY